MSAPPTTEIMANTGATGHFIDGPTSKLPTKPITKSNPAIPVLLPNGQFMHSKSTTTLPIPTLSPTSTKAHVFHKLASGSLLSVGKICDENCTAVFTKKKMTIHKTNNIQISTCAPPILTGTREAPKQPLWSVKLPSTIPSAPTQRSHLANSVLHNPSIRNRVAFYHAALFSPTISTWTKAVRLKQLSSWPELTMKQITKYAPNSIATIKGHQHRTRSNIQSTKTGKKRTLPLSYAAVAAAAVDIITNSILIAAINAHQF